MHHKKEILRSLWAHASHIQLWLRKFSEGSAGEPRT